MVEAFGARGDVWLRGLPDLVAEMANRWGFEIGPPFDLSYGYVAAATLSGGVQAVFKVAAPDPDGEGRREIPALRAYGGQGAARLLNADEARCALLVERLSPGDTLVPLAQQDDDSATRIAASVMRWLWRPAPEDAAFLPIADWFASAFERHRSYYGGSGPFPPDLYGRAGQLAAELIASAPTEVLLHGDLHHYNVLSATRAPWLAIDPKGVVGDPGYDAGPLLCNPYRADLLVTRHMLARRLAILAEELDYPRSRLRDWGIAHAVLSACWSTEEGRRGWTEAIRIAGLLSEL